jgi:type IV pilus biogenesis/stability protein PilW
MVCRSGVRPMLHGRRICRSLLLVLLVYLLSGCGASSQVRLQADEHYQLAQSYLGTRSYLLAEQEIRRALDLRSDESRYFELLALVYQAQGRLQLAEEAYRLALQQTDVPPSVLVNYSTLLLLRERSDDAIALVQQALRDPHYTKPALAYTNLGLAYFKKGALHQAAKYLHRALEYQADLPEAHYNLGLVYARMHEPDKAIREFREAIRFRPSYVEAHASLGEVLLEVGRTEEARLAFERVVTLAPDSDMAVASRAQLKLLTP